MSYLPRRFHTSQGLLLFRMWYYSSSLRSLRAISLILDLNIGHKWCSSCLKKHKGDPLCGECRQPKGKPHRIYLELEELVDDQIALVVGGLNAIDMESSASDIEEFNRTVRKLGQKFNADPDVSVSNLWPTKTLNIR